MTDLPELLTVAQAATFLQMTEAALRIAMSRGQVPGVVKLGDRVRIRRDDLRAHFGLKKPVE
jgi:hypothetical protein